MFRWIHSTTILDVQSIRIEKYCFSSENNIENKKSDKYNGWLSLFQAMQAIQMVLSIFFFFLYTGMLLFSPERSTMNQSK